MKASSIAYIVLDRSSLLQMELDEKRSILLDLRNELQKSRQRCDESLNEATGKISELMEINAQVRGGIYRASFRLSILSDFLLLNITRRSTYLFT